MSEITFHVPSIHCDACERGIRRALEGVPGVAGVVVELNHHRVTVRFDGSQTDVSALRREIEESGFEVG